MVDEVKKKEREIKQETRQELILDWVLVICESEKKK